MKYEVLFTEGKFTYRRVPHCKNEKKSPLELEGTGLNNDK